MCIHRLKADQHTHK